MLPSEIISTLYLSPQKTIYVEERHFFFKHNWPSSVYKADQNLVRRGEHLNTANKSSKQQSMKKKSWKSMEILRDIISK